MNRHKWEAELILLNGDFRTMGEKNASIEAVAVKQGRIMATGSDDEIKDLAGPGTDMIDLHGRLGLPGFMDGHFHFYDWALGRRQLALADVKSFDDLIERLKEAVQDSKTEGWILGQGWNESDWPEHRMPTRDDLDAVAPFNPVALWRCDLHLVAVNSRALELAGIDETTPNPPDGVIARNESGRINGILRELASNLVKAVIPPPVDDELSQTMREGIQHLHSLGLTGLNDARLMGGLEGAPALKAWQLLNERGELDLRCWVCLPGERIDEAIALGLRTGLGDNRLRIGHLKYFADGGMGARTAWLVEPYLDAECGMPLGSIKALKEDVEKAEAAGLAVMIHAIGDRANRELITVFEELKGTRASLRKAPPAVAHRIEHAQMIRSEDIERLARLQVTACVQPHNMILDINMIDESVGARGRWTYPYKEMIDAGVPILFSSDAPVCDESPLVGIHAAVTRQRRDGTPEGGWYPEQRISVEEAVRCYTTVPARFYGQGYELGSIEPGKQADLVVLDRNIFSIDPMEIAGTRVDMTLFEGKIVYRRDAQRGIMV